MIMRRKIYKIFLLALLFLAARPISLPACSACYGDPDSSMSAGLTWAISVMVAVVSCVLAGLVAFFVRAAKHSEAVDEDAVPEGLTGK